MKIKFLLLFCIVSVMVNAQETPIKEPIKERIKEPIKKYFNESLQFFRPNNKLGINMFETTKNDTTPFKKLRVRIGGNFTQDFQAIKHSNNATPVFDADSVNVNQLIGLKNGFDRAMANLNVDAQLYDGIRLSLTLYLSTRHHEETWVKGGYIQIDKFSFLKSAVLDKIMESFTIKVGAYEVDYGDQHFRRSDGGNAIYNPFIENYIMDEFATEIGGEIFYHHKSGLLAMIGITNGQLNPTVVAATKIDAKTGELNKYKAAYLGKIGYDHQFKKDLRFRLTGSFYVNRSAANNTLFSGDRTGSHYFYIMENTAATAGGNAFSGRFNPQFNQQVVTFMINPFVKFKGLELFGTYEMAHGRTITEPDMRVATQYAVDLIYRFFRTENFWIGARYNSVMATLKNNPNDITINRAAASVGGFITKYIMMKVEYVNQQYKHFGTTDIRSGGKFHGFMVEASVAF